MALVTLFRLCGKPAKNLVLIAALIFLTTCGSLDNSDLPSDADDNDLGDGMKISEIYFADPNLKACIESYDIDYAFELQTLACNNKGITDLTGLEHFTGLIHLELDGNTIEDLTPLSGLIKLAELYLNRNTNLADIIALSDLKLLSVLDLNFNAIEEITPLSGLTNISYLGLAYNNISDLSPLGNLNKIISLNLANNVISQLTLLKNLTGLDYLYLSNNNISDVSDLKNLTSLDYLYLNNNNISDISDLESLTDLTFLSLSDNQIQWICSLDNLTNLNGLHLKNNQIIDDVSCLITLQKIKSSDSGYELKINLYGNNFILCTELTLLENGLPYTDLVVRPDFCL